MVNNSKVKRLSNELKKLYTQKKLLLEKYDNTLGTTNDAEEIDADINELSDRIAAFIENEYALAVFEKYSKEKPNLIRIKTGEIVSWDDAFGSDFENVSKSLRHSLVGLVEEPGRYRFEL